MLLAQDAHRRLETQLAEWHHQEAAILFPSCFDANAGLFEVRIGYQTWRSYVPGHCLLRNTAMTT